METDRSTSTCDPEARALADRIKARARGLGFTAVGVSPAAPFDDAARRLTAWLAAGRHGTMRYLEEHVDARRDPARILPGAQSIVSLAANYYSSERSPGDGGPASGKISRYAWGRNYHVVLRERMEALLSDILAMAPGAAGLVATDATPLPEKEIASRAGIGWIGRNTNLITETHGSWVFLGEILLTIPLAYDAPFSTDLCGSCVLCLEACPTGALIGPHEIDAARCISYATVEHRGPIPESFRGRMDGWVFGCDVCQDVCPRNHAAPETEIDDFRPRDAAVGPPLAHLASITMTDYKERFGDSAVRRTRRDGLRRNARFLLDDAPAPARNVE